ncbi:MAG: hypothetical protein VKL20_07020 [Synechocystis sp.]|nr:hypothetical protein [Synechocystis sp.]
MIVWNPTALQRLITPISPLQSPWRSITAIGLAMGLSWPLLIETPVRASSVAPLPCARQSSNNVFSFQSPPPFSPTERPRQDSVELWWAKEQLDVLEAGLIKNWFAMPDAQRVDIIVDHQGWTQLNYLERYRLVHQFATIAREHRYNLRITNQDNQCLVAYWCDFEQTPYQCQMNFAAAAEGNLPVYQFQRGDFQFPKGEN